MLQGRFQFNMHKVDIKYKLILCIDLSPILGTTQHTCANVPRLKKQNL